MSGTVSVMVENNRVRYSFELKRNITILSGDSAAGKTTLIEMISAYEQNPNSGVTVQCKKDCRVVSGVRWQEQLKLIRGSVVFIDDGNEFIREKAFADQVKKTDNYYVIATRINLSMIPYSVEEIYEIKNKTKGHGKIKRLYSGFRQLYPTSAAVNR